MLSYQWLQFLQWTGVVLLLPPLPKFVAEEALKLGRQTPQEFKKTSPSPSLTADNGISIKWRLTETKKLFESGLCLRIWYSLEDPFQAGGRPQLGKAIASEPRSAPLYFSTGSLGQLRLLSLNGASRPRRTRETLLSNPSSSHGPKTMLSKVHPWGKFMAWNLQTLENLKCLSLSDPRDLVSYKDGHWSLLISIREYL